MGYLRYWALFNKPFARTEGDYFFSAPPQREAIAGLSYFAASGFGTAFLVAPPRCGASWLMRHVGRMHGLGDCATEVVLTTGLHQNCGDVAGSLGQALAIHSNIDEPVTLEMVDLAIRASEADGVHVLWMIDGLHPCTITTARSLLASHGNLSVVLSVTPDEYCRFASLLGREDQTLRLDLDPLCVEETINYLGHALADVGCRRTLFDDGAAVRLHELTGGAIADLSLAAEASLVIGARYGLPMITTPIVEASLESLTQAA